MKNYSAKNVDEYIIHAPKEAQNKLRELRAVIRLAVPKAEESISWGIPFYKYNGMLAGFSSLKEHVDFGFFYPIADKYKKILEKKGYITKMKIIQIRFDQKVPAQEIKDILKEQAKKNEEKK